MKGAAGAACVAFDVAGAIAAFVADDTQDVLVLPRLTTGQRKQARKLADQYQDLSCESFGFGEDRRLHLFKKGSAKRAERTPETQGQRNYEMPSLNDQGVAPDTAPVEHSCSVGERALRDGVGEPEAVISPSMTVTLTKSALEASDCSKQGRLRECHLDTSTNASGSDRSPASSIPELPAEPQVVHMRNTFVHFGGASADEREVQSMPFGMFRQSLLAELSAEFEPLHAASDARVETREYAPLPGTEVVIDGLVKSPAFNGLHGIVQSLDEASGRYNVLLSPATCGQQWAKIKGANLTPAVESSHRRVLALACDLGDSESCAVSCSSTTPLWQKQSVPAATLVLTALV